MPIFHYLSNLFNPFFFLGLIFFFHLFLIQQLQMINFQEAFQIREKWKIFNCLLSRQRKIAQDKIAHFSIIQNNVVSPSPFLFFSFFFPSIYSLSQFTSQNLGYSMVVIQLGPWGSEMYRSLFAQGIIFFSKITQSNGNSLFLIFKFNSLIRVCMRISYVWRKHNDTHLRDCG